MPNTTIPPATTSRTLLVDHIGRPCDARVALYRIEYRFIGTNPEPIAARYSRVEGKHLVPARAG